MASSQSALHTHGGGATFHHVLGFFGDRLQVNALLIVLCFAAVLTFESITAARIPSYLLAFSMLLSLPQWTDVFGRRTSWIVLALLLLLASSSFWSRPESSAGVLSTFVEAGLVLLFVVAFAECQLRGQLRRWMGRAMAVLGLATVIWAIGLFYVDEPTDGRLIGLGQLDGHVVTALVFGVVLILVLDVAATDRSTGWRLVALASAVVLAWAIYLSDSRNAWISAILGVGVFVMAKRVTDPQRFVAGVVTLGFVLSVLLAVLVANDASREWLVPRGTSYRPEIWGDAIADLLRHGALFGRGVNTGNYVLAGGIGFEHPHSMYISVAYQGGLVALGLFLLLIAVVLRLLVRNYHEPDAALALGVFGITLPAYLLDGHELLGSVSSTWFLFWLPVAIGVGFSWRSLLRGL